MRTDVRPEHTTSGISALRMFLVGFALWVATIIVTAVTRNVVLIPTIILLGSFLVPVTFVALAFERWRDEHITTELVVRAFVTGGALGVLGAAVLESYLENPSSYLFLGVGLIEEGVKLAALVWVTRMMTVRHTRDGIVLGAAVGFGFAALESAGYAFVSMLTVRGLSLPALVETELLRGVLAPVGHGLWTAIVGGVLFSQARHNVLRYTRAVVGTYLLVSVLHALWDSMRQIAAAVTLALTGSSWDLGLLARGYVPQPTPSQAHLFTALSVGGLMVVSAVGIEALRRQWRAAEAEDPPRTRSSRRAARARAAPA